MKRWLGIAVAWACAAGVYSSWAAAASTAANEVQTSNGAVRGLQAHGILSYKGIPYAQPPVGPLRWRAPQPALPWQGVRVADAYAHDCMQTPMPGDAAPLRTTPAEDCLYLNLWRPASARARAHLPVMVWIYGGGLVTGGSSPAVYDGSGLALQGVVFVSFNYRLGRFGFFAHPALTASQEDGGLSGNYGYLDQIAALRWVHANIARYGGDPGNVTVFGESAGGGSVNTLMASPMARGLFQKAIVMSGGGRDNFALNGRDRQSAEQSGLAFAHWAGVTAEGPAALAALRALPADKVNEGGGVFGGGTAPPPSGPMIDGRVVVPLEAAYRAGNVARVPFIAGSNSDDLGFTSGKDPWERFGPNADLARHYYAAYGPGRTRVGKAVAADALMTEPARFLVSLMRRHGQPAWYYRAGYTPESMRQVWALGLPHAHEIPFFLRTIDVAGYVGPTTRSDQAMSTVMSATFVNFAKTGNPNGSGRPAWPMYDDKTRPIMDFTLEGARGGADSWRERLDLLEAAAEQPGEAVPAQPVSSGPPVMAVGLTAQPPFTTTMALIGDILDDPAAKAILDQHLPGLSNSDYIARLRELTLKSVQSFMPSVVSDQALAAMDVDFARLSPPRHD